MLQHIKNIFSPPNKNNHHADAVHVIVDQHTEDMLHDVVNAIVNGLGFKAAMIAVVEERIDSDDQLQLLLVVRAFAIDPNFVLGEETLLAWGERFTGQKLIGSSIVINEENEQINEAVRVIRQNESHVTVERLYDLFAPVLNKQQCFMIQRTANLKSFVTVPFRNKEGQLIGNLYAAHSNAQIPAEMIRQLKAFTGMATTALDNARLYRSNLRTTGREEILKTTITHLLTVTLDTQKLLDDIAKSVVNTMGFRACMVAIVEPKDNKQTLRVVSYQFISGLQGLLEWGENMTGLRLSGQYLYIDEETAQKNLAVRTVLNNLPHAHTRKLSDLFSPTLPDILSNRFQNQFGFKELVTIPLRNKEGQLRGNMYVGSGAEITEAEIDELKTFVLAASIAIDNANQYHKTEHLYRESRRMGLIASNFGHAAHRIKNMLGPSRLALEKELRKSTTNLTEKQIALLTDIKNQMVGSLELIQELSKRVQDNDEDRISVVEALSTAKKDLEEGNYGYKLPSGITIELKTSNDKLLVVAKEDLSEIFRVIMKNACEAMGENGTLILQANADLEEHSNQAIARVAIADTGPGIPEDKMKDLFDLKPGSSKSGGMGYGIWGAYLTIQWYGGSLRYETRTQDSIDKDPALVGQKPGTTAIISLPLLQDQLGSVE